MMSRPERSDMKQTTQLSGAEAERLLTGLMREYATDLKRIAFLYVNDHSECEDIIQEVYISCFENLADFRHEANYKTWLTRITINKCKDHRKRWSVRNLLYKPLVGVMKKEHSAEDQYIHTENSREILKEVSSLPPKFKEVLILYYFHEMTMQEVSEILGIKHNTVKSRLLRGKKLLSGNLERGNWNGSL